MSLIEVKNVIKKYGNKVVLGLINLKIEKGISIVIFGVNGVGKFILCEIIVNIKK